MTARITSQAIVIFPRAKQTKNKGMGNIKIIAKTTKEAKMFSEKIAIAISRLIIQFFWNKFHEFIRDFPKEFFLITEKPIAYLDSRVKDLETQNKNNIFNEKFNSHQ